MTPARNIALALACFAALLLAAVHSRSAAAGSGSPALPADTPSTSTPTSWDPKAAAAYLDQREKWWNGWEDAAREHGTFCVSCHTSVPYAIARPALRKVLNEQTPNDNERQLIENVAKRVRIWKEIAPVYTDKDGPNKSAESRSTEAVLLSLVLANHDAESGKLSADTRAAFDNLWALQQTSGDHKGAWLWQLFDLSPWESNISPYYGATIAAVAVGTAPENYRSTPQIQNNIKMLGEYLNREYSSQPLVNRATLLWASDKVPGLVSPELQKSIVEDILSKQQADGGWSLFPFTKTWRDWTPSSIAGKWTRNDGSPQNMSSDGFATGLVVYVLQQSGVSRDNTQLQRGRAWLVQNQNKTEGYWVTYSLNKRRELSSNAGRFMSDAATAYAVLALTN
jgi:squalene-hopene/tetraprenyl-beta-curcumene cyclase